MAPKLSGRDDPASLSILAPTRYPWRFNGPRRSRHRISNRDFVPFNRISEKIEGFTIFNPLPPRRFDLIHGFNRIPLGRVPFVIGFESHLPRAFGLETSSYFRTLSRVLASPRCRGIVAITDHAAGILRTQHGGSRQGDAILAKLVRRYPNVEIQPQPPKRATGALRVAFVGNHFARKGGCVVVRAVELALKAGLPVSFDIVSSLEVGGAIWTDPADAAFFTPYLARLDLPNIRWHPTLPNAAVRDLLKAADVSLLPTFGDTCGFGVLESMASGTPVIATRQGALPEFIQHETTGYLLDLETNAVREWIHLGAVDRGSRRFERVFAAEVERLARGCVALLRRLIETPRLLTAMSAAAWADAVRLFDADAASAFWDDYYVSALTDVAR